MPGTHSRCSISPHRYSAAWCRQNRVGKFKSRDRIRHSRHVVPRNWELVASVVSLVRVRAEARQRESAMALWRLAAGTGLGLLVTVAVVAGIEARGQVSGPGDHHAPDGRSREENNEP